MNKIFFMVLALCVSTTASAWENNYKDVDSNPDDGSLTEEQETEIERNQEYPYESHTGTRYKYDLNDPSNKIMYEVDPAAQIKDSVNPMVDIDRGLGQFGGGSE